MPVTYDEAKDLHSQLQRRDEKRHYELKALRRYWQGHYWDDSSDRAGVSNVSQLFRDLKGNQSDIGPDLKLVHNMLQEVCVKYQTFLSPVPMVRTFTDPPYSEQRRRQATLKERVIYGTWWMNRMAQRMGEIAWYLPLMGDCFTGIWPDFERKIPRLIVRSPEHAHPVKSLDGSCLDIVVFHWEAPERAIARQYPGYQPGSPQKGKFSLRGRSAANRGGETTCEILEYSDGDFYGMWAGGQEVKKIQHGYGFNLFGQMGFIPVPGEVFNHGAVEQTVSLVEMGNALHSLLFQATLENVFPTMVITDPAKAPAEILRGPGSVVPVNAGGRVEYLTPPAQALPVQMGFLRDNADKILEAAGMPRVNFGQSPATSIVTGAAVNELQGAGTGSTVEMVQGTQIGPELSGWNEKALFMYGNEFRDDKIEMYGLARTSGMELNGRGNAFAFSFKGSEIVGSPRNEVVFSPHMNDHERLVMNLQALGARLVSKASVREQMGISDNDAMVEEIYGEAVEEGVIQFVLAQLGEQPTPEAAARVEEQVGAFVDPAARAVPPAPHPLLSLGAQPQAALPGGPAEGPTQQPPGPAAGPGAAPSSQVVTLPDAIAAFQNVQGVQGRVFLVGEIAARQQTAGDIEVALTAPADQRTLTGQLQQFAGRLVFHAVPGEPEEQHVEVTPGQQAAPRNPQAELAPAGAPTGG